MRRALRLPTVERSMASLAPTPTRAIEAGLRPRPPAICTWATRAHSGRHGQRAREAARHADDAHGRSGSGAQQGIYAEAAIEDLRWLGIRWQEGPDKGGPFAPYVQSRRRATYLAAWRKLLRRGFLYPCRCSRKDLETALGAPHERVTAAHQEARRKAGRQIGLMDDEPIYPGTCRNWQGRVTQLPGPTVSDNDEPEGMNWRFRVPDGEAIEFEDRNLGRSGLSPARTLATLWSGGATACPAISWPAWPTTRRCASLKWCAEPTC